MKGLKKLALATAVAAAPFAHADLVAMDDSALSEMTGQAGVTIDVDLQMEIENIIYVDRDGNNGVDGEDKGAITMSGIKMGEIDAAGDLVGTAQIRGITIDADGEQGLVIGLEQIGDTSGNGIDITVDSVTIGDGAGQLAVQEAKETEFANQVGALVAPGGTFEGDPAAAQAFLSESSNAGDAEYDAAVAAISSAAQAAGLAAQNGNIGGFKIENFRNYIQNDIVEEYNAVFGMALRDDQGVVTGDFASTATGGRYVRGEIIINGNGNAALGTSGLQIAAKFGGALDKAAWVDGNDTNASGTADQFGEFGVADMGFFAGDDTDLDGINDTIVPMTFNLNVDVVDHESWDNATPGTANVAALKLSNMAIEGTIMMGSIYLDSSTATVNQQSLGSVLIKDIDMAGTEVFIYGH